MKKVHIYLITFVLSVASIATMMLYGIDCNNPIDDLPIILLVLAMNLIFVNLFIRLSENKDLRYLFLSIFTLILVTMLDTPWTYVIIVYLPIALAIAIISTIKIKKS